jgi:hypothetical protein
MIPEGGFPCGEMGEWAGMGKERCGRSKELKNKCIPTTFLPSKPQASLDTTN